MKTWIDGDVLTIELPLFDPPQLSRSGKTRLIASVGRCARSNVTVDGKTVYICCNAFIYKDSTKKNDSETDVNGGS